MFSEIYKFSTIALSVLLLSLGITYYFKTTTLKLEIAGVKVDLADAETKVSNYKRETDGYKVALQNQSDKILKLQVDYNNSIDTYKYQLKTQTSKIRYKYIHDTIYIEVNSTKENRTCEDIKQIQINTYNADWNKL